MSTTGPNAASIAAAATPTRGRAPSAKVNTANLKTSYCNVCSTNTTREEVVLNFGINQSWERPENAEVSLDHRIILSPFLAKRLSVLLSKAIEDYESRHGALG